MILVIRHVENEGPGMLGDLLVQKGFTLKTIDLFSGENLPRELRGIEGILCMGGPMNVYEEDSFPFLKNEDAFLKNALRTKTPFLGICLGAQLLAKAAGAEVTKSPAKEIGWSSVSLTEAGKKHPLFRGMKESLAVFQWHSDMFKIPRNGELLAFGSLCPHQALSVGGKAVGIQFHIEVTEKEISDWSLSEDPAFKRQAQEMTAYYADNREALKGTLKIFAENLSSFFGR